MSERTREAVEAAFADAVRVWRLTPGAALPDVIDAATECLVVGMDSPALRELAGVSPRESQFVLEPLIVDTVHDLGLSQLLDADVHTAALGAMLRRLDAGRMTPRELASWPTLTSVMMDLRNVYRSWTSMTSTMQVPLRTTRSTIG